MKKNWEIVRLGDLCESDLGKTLNKSHDTGNFHPYLCSINVLWDKIDLSTLKEARFNENEIEKYSVQKGDLLICEGGDIGRCAIWEKEESFLYQNAIHRVRFNDRINPRYCLYYLKHLKDTGTLDSRYGKGVTIKHLVKSSLHSIPIPVPPLPVQARIVDELDCLQGILSKKRQQLAEYHSLAQAIFHQMFGDPVVNEKGWEMKRLGEVTNKIGSGATPKGGDKSYKKEGISLIRSLNVFNSYFKEENLAHIDNEQALALKNVTIEQGDILLNITGASVARCCIVPKHILPARVNQHVSIIRLNDSANQVFLAAQLTNTHMQEKILNISREKAATREALTKSQIEEFSIILPPLPLQQSFAARIAAIDSQREQLAASIRELETLLACRMETLLNCPQA